jgi:hypothetical protein
MNLYRIQLSTVSAYGDAYVIADTTDEAYKIVREILEEKNIGFYRERELRSITVLAQDKIYPAAPNILYHKDMQR